MKGRGRGRCRACINRAALDREVALQVLTLTRADCRDWLPAFATWLFQRAPEDPGLVADFNRHVEFIARLDSLLDDAPKCSSEWLLKNIAVSDMRAHLQVMKFLEERFGLLLPTEAKREAAERERCAAILRRVQSKPYCAAIEAFAESLHARGCSPLTQRQYLSTAAAFCDAANVKADTWEASAPSAFVSLVPGQRINLGVFVRFCQKVLAWSVEGLPSLERISKNTRSAQKLQKAIRRIESHGEAATKLMLASALESAFALRRGQLRNAEILLQKASLYLVLDGEHHRIPRSLQSIALRWQALSADSTTDAAVAVPEDMQH